MVEKHSNVGSSITAAELTHLAGARAQLRLAQHNRRHTSQPHTSAEEKLHRQGSFNVLQAEPKIVRPVVLCFGLYT